MIPIGPMSRPQGKIFLLVLLIGLVSCSPPPTATIPSSPQPIKVAISPILEPARKALHSCAISLPGMSFILEVIPQTSQNFNSSDLILWWGDKPEEVDFAFQIAEEELVVIANPDNKDTGLSASELQTTFSGRVENWSEISTFEEAVTVWIYPEESYSSEIFKSAVLGEYGYSRLANIAPSPGPMLEEISAYPGAIGFVPGAWLSAEVSQVDIEPDIQLALNKPVLALTKSEPLAGVKDLIACLQTGDGKEELANEYSPISK